MDRLRTFAIVASFALSGCFVFDESLYMTADAGADRPALRGELAEVCGADAPLLFFPPGAQSLSFDVDTSGRADSARDLIGCTGAVQSGPDLFLAIDAVRGEHWHFHVDVDPFAGRAAANPAIYVLRGCDERACSLGDGLDVCSAGSDEHFTFLPDADGRYVVGFDSPELAFQGRVGAFRTVCGDGNRDHSENCDDGNVLDGDGCDSRCRTELRGASPSEQEVDDDVFSANALQLATGSSMVVRGSADNPCEVDVYALEVSAGSSIVASITGDGGGCSTTLGGVALDLLELDGTRIRVRARGAVPTGGSCPAIAADAALARNLPAGTYFLRVTLIRERPTAAPYELTVGLE